MLNKHLRYIQEGVRSTHKITIMCTEQAANETLIPLIEYIKQTADPGHSFDIVVDPDMSETRKSFGMDGDGAAYIHSIKTEVIEK